MPAEVVTADGLSLEDQLFIELMKDGDTRFYTTAKQWRDGVNKSSKDGIVSEVAAKVWFTPEVQEMVAVISLKAKNDPRAAELHRNLRMAMESAVADALMESDYFVANFPEWQVEAAKKSFSKVKRAYAEWLRTRCRNPPCALKSAETLASVSTGELPAISAKAARKSVSTPQAETPAK